MACWGAACHQLCCGDGAEDFIGGTRADPATGEPTVGPTDGETTVGADAAAFGATCIGGNDADAVWRKAKPDGL